MRPRSSDRSRKLAVSQNAPVHDPLFLSEADRRLAERRREILLALPERPSRNDFNAAANDFGMSVRQVRRYRTSYERTGELTSLLPTRPSGGRGRVRKIAQHAVFREILRSCDVTLT